MEGDLMKLVTEELERNPNPSPEELERLADILLSPTLRNRRRTKSQEEEYPILSSRQLQRRQGREIPFSALPKNVKRAFGIAYSEEEEEC